MPAISPDGLYQWDGAAWQPIGGARPAATGPPLQVIRPDGGMIMRIGIRTTAIACVVELLLALGLTFASHIRTLQLHASPVVYAILTLTAIVEGLAGAVLAQAYSKRVSIGVWSDRLVFDYLGRSQSTIALDGAFSAEAVSVEFSWLFFVLRMRYIVFLRRDSAYVQTLDAAEWPAPALDSLIDHFRMRGVPIRGDWKGPSLRLFGPGPSLGSRYHGSTRLRTGPYSLQAVSAAIVIFSAGLLITLPFAIG